MSKAASPNVVQCYGAVVEPPHYCLVMERLERSLTDVLYNDNWQWNSSVSRPTAILNLYGTNIDNNYSANTTMFYQIDRVSNVYDYYDDNNHNLYFNHTPSE
jgi:hypothetical protein